MYKAYTLKIAWDKVMWSEYQSSSIALVRQLFVMNNGIYIKEDGIIPKVIH